MRKTTEGNLQKAKSVDICGTLHRKYISLIITTLTM